MAKKTFTSAGFSGVQAFRRRLWAEGRVLTVGRGKPTEMLRDCVTWAPGDCRNLRLPTDLKDSRLARASCRSICRKIDDVSIFSRNVGSCSRSTLLQKPAAGRRIWDDTPLGEKVATSTAAGLQPLFIEPQ